MPELPEVETVRKTLEYQLGNPRIQEVQIFYPRLVENISIDRFRAQLLGKCIEGYQRIGKYLIFDLQDVYLVSHLRMEGKYFVEEKQMPYDASHTHAIITFVDGRELRYHDTRKFGRMYLYPKDGHLEEQKAFANVGYDVFDERLNAAYLYKQFHKRRIVLKQALLDQSVMAGVGNIYADEICFALQMHPETKIYHLRKQDFANVLYYTRHILSGAIKDGGTTIRSYTSSLGVDGRFQLQLRVHAKKDAPCGVCGTKILKKVVATRGTYYCPNCQKKKYAKKRSKIIGLTGVMGAGKSAAIAILKKLQIPVLDCDEINRALLQKDATGYLAIRSQFSDDIYDEFDNIDPKKLSSIIFQDIHKKAQLESILHPLIQKEMKKEIARLCKHPMIVVEVPLLFEVKWESFFDEIWVVACEEAIIFERLEKYRGYSTEEAKRRLAHQMPQADKIKRAHVVLRNDTDIATLEEQIRKAIEGKG